MQEDKKIANELNELAKKYAQIIMQMGLEEVTQGTVQSIIFRGMLESAKYKIPDPETGDS